MTTAPTAAAPDLTPPEEAGEQFIDFGAEIARHGRTRGAAPALIVGARALSWEEFADLVARTAARLRAEGAGPGVMIASLSENSLEHVVLYAATVAAGACIVPLPFSATPQALARMVADSAPLMLFASPAQRAVAETLGAADLRDLSRLEAWAEGAAPAAPAEARPDDLFDIIYSSGTTGLPKGIVHDHRFRSRQLARSAAFGIDAEARMMLSTPVYSNTTLFGMLAALAAGATLIVMEKFSTTGFLELAQQTRATHAVLVPVQYMRLMDEPRFEEFNLSSFQAKYSTSAPLPAPLIARLMARWPGNLIEIYGMTEGGFSTVLDCAAHPGKWDSVGRPGEGTDMRVIDEAGRELPYGSYGEIVGRAGSMTRGYHNLPDKTAELVWRSPEGLAFIRSGDMGRFDEDGFLHLLDRKKDMILSGGFNVYAADLEAVLRQHPDVADVAVIAVPSREWGETPLGLVVPRAGTAPDPETIRAWANERLGKTQRLSRVVLRTDLPRSEIGKILKRELREEYAPAVAAG